LTGDPNEVDLPLAAVMDQSRRRLLDALLGHGEATATTLAAAVPITRQAIAKHLVVLERAGLVEGRRHGREVRFAIRPEELDAAMRRMAQIASEWDARLAEIKRLGEAAASRPAAAKREAPPD
jgi:DNA-binding transcriptional ArsR family regulator